MKLLVLMASQARDAEKLAALLMNCLNLSLDQTVVPTPFKTLTIVPVLKHTTATTLTPSLPSVENITNKFVYIQLDQLYKVGS